jgi:hypothetical protein
MERQEAELVFLPVAAVAVVEQQVTVDMVVHMVVVERYAIMQIVMEVPK